MQSVLSRIWTRVAVSISYHDNHYKPRAPTYPTKLDETTDPFLKWCLIGWNSKLSYSKTGCHWKVKEPSLSYYLPIARGRIVGFMSFPRVAAVFKLQIILFTIWSGVTVSFDSNHYTTNTFYTYAYIYVHVCVWGGLTLFKSSSSDAWALSRSQRRYLPGWIGVIFLYKVHIKIFRVCLTSTEDLSVIHARIAWVSLMVYQTFGVIQWQSYCYIIAEGFQFMPLSLVRLRTFRLRICVSWVQH